MSVEEQARDVRTLIDRSSGLIFVDNLETVDDPRVIEFLDTLPVGVKALVTSRRTRVRVSVMPIDVGRLDASEGLELVESLRELPGLGYIENLARAEIDRITKACDELPLAIRWTLSRAESANEAVRRAERLIESNTKDDELLEFSFRRVLDGMEPAELSVMRTLSIFQDPSPIEALATASGERSEPLQDSLQDLVNDALVQRLFDSDRNDYVYTVAPLTRAFVYRDLTHEPGVEQKIRRRLSDWYEAKDVHDVGERAVVRQLRQGKASPESALLDLAQSAERRGDMNTAEDMYRQALERNPRSWQTSRAYAEFERHANKNLANALTLYEQAAANAPSRGSDRALIYREWGMLLRDSGRPDATQQAIDKFEVAFEETPNNAVLVHALASMHARLLHWRLVIELLEPIKDHRKQKTRDLVLPLLLTAYDKTTEIVKAAELRDLLSNS